MPFPGYMEHYNERVDLFEAEIAALQPEPPPCLILLGDSISEQNRVPELRQLPVFNMGIGGCQAALPEGGLLSRIWLVPQANPVQIFLLIGINDMIWEKPPNVFIQQYGEVLDALTGDAPGAQVYTQSVMPTREPYAYLNPRVLTINPLIESVANQRGLPYIDLFSHMVDDTGQLRAEFSADGVHLTPEGVDFWNSLLELAPPPA